MDYELDHLTGHFRERITRLLNDFTRSASDSDSVDFDIYSYRFDKLARDLLMFPEFEVVGIVIGRALDVIIAEDRLSNNPMAISERRPCPSVEGQHGRPKFIISCDQLTYLLGRYQICFSRRFLPAEGLTNTIGDKTE